MCTSTNVFFFWYSFQNRLKGFGVQEVTGNHRTNRHQLVEHAFITVLMPSGSCPDEMSWMPPSLYTSVPLWLCLKSTNLARLHHALSDPDQVCSHVCVPAGTGDVSVYLKYLKTPVLLNVSMNFIQPAQWASSAHPPAGSSHFSSGSRHWWRSETSSFSFPCFWALPLRCLLHKLHRDSVAAVLLETVLLFAKAKPGKKSSGIMLTLARLKGSRWQLFFYYHTILIMLMLAYFESNKENFEHLYTAFQVILYVVMSEIKQNYNFFPHCCITHVIPGQFCILKLHQSISLYQQ